MSFYYFFIKGVWVDRCFRSLLENSINFFFEPFPNQVFLEWLTILIIISIFSLTFCGLMVKQALMLLIGSL